MTLDGKVCIVTGATGGMGAAIVRLFAAEGAHVVATDRTQAALDELAASGGSVVGLAGDITDPAFAPALVALAVERHGRLDAAVNAAGIETETQPLHLCDDDTFDRIMDVNVRGLFLCMKAEVTAMLATGGGSIVNIASTNSFKARPLQPAYSTSKHAALGLTRAAALDYATLNIRVNAICPGAIDTPMLRGAIERRGRDPHETARRLSPIGRFGYSDEIAKAARFLCSDDSSFTTGHALAVDGGMLTS
jgi:glucose 1-dehydrogenase